MQENFQGEKRLAYQRTTTQCRCACQRWGGGSCPEDIGVNKGNSAANGSCHI